MVKVPVEDAARRIAESLVDRGRAGMLHRTRPTLEDMAARNPRRLVEVALMLAEALAEAVPTPNVLEHKAYLRAAHAAYERGERYQWVVEGERVYQREKKREYKARKRAEAA